MNLAYPKIILYICQVAGLLINQQMVEKEPSTR